MGPERLPSLPSPSSFFSSSAALAASKPATSQADARASGLTFTGPGPSVTFDRTGRGTADATVQFSIVPTNASAPDHQKRCLRLDPSGRVRTRQEACS